MNALPQIVFFLVAAMTVNAGLPSLREEFDDDQVAFSEDQAVENDGPPFPGFFNMTRYADDDENEFSSDTDQSAMEEAFLKATMSDNQEQVKALSYVYGGYCNNNAVNTVTLSTTQYTILRSPYFPRYYPNNRRCDWRINAPSGRRLRAYCPTILLAWGDYIRTIDGSRTYYTRGWRFALGHTFVGNTGQVRFYSNYWGRFIGFICYIYNI